MAKGLKVSCCRAQLPTPGFHGYLRLPLGSEADAVVQRLGSGCGGWAASAPLQGPALGQGLQEWHGQLSRMDLPSWGEAKMPEERNYGHALQCHSLNPSPAFLPKRDWGTVSCQKVKGVEGKQERGHTHHPHPLSPGQLACWATASLPCCPGRQGPRVWAVPTSLLG